MVYDATCHRCPANHLKITNSLITSNERQTPEKNGGIIDVVFESSCDMNSLLSSVFDLKYIYQKNDRFETHSNASHVVSKFDTLYYEIDCVLAESIPDPQIREIRAYNYTQGMISWHNQGKNENQIMNRLISRTGTLSKQQYAKVKEALCIEQHHETNKYQVSSIESIKGLEGERCLFILTSDLAAYLFGDKNEENKIKNALYVALTRSTDTIVVLITKELEEQYKKQFIIDFFTISEK